MEAWKLVLGPIIVSTVNQPLIDATFPLTHPERDYNTAEGKRSLLVYCQALLAGFKAATRQPENLSKGYDVRQEPDENRAAFLSSHRRLSEGIHHMTQTHKKVQQL